jgi:hypothetical protein
MKIVICGSMSMCKQMVEIGKTLEEKGHEVFLPKGAEKYASGKTQTKDNHESIEHKIEHDLIKEHYSSIKNADAVVVANYDKKGIKNYIGGNSFLEAGFSHVLSKKLYFMNEIPDMIYSDELRAFQPIILNGDLSAIDLKPYDAMLI